MNYVTPRGRHRCRTSAMMHNCPGFQQGNVWHFYMVVLSLISSWSKLTYVQISRLQVHQTIMYPILHCTSFSSLLPMIVSVWSFATVSCWDRFDRVQKADQCLAVVVFDFSDLCMTSWMIHKGTRGVAPKKTNERVSWKRLEQKWTIN